MATYDLTSSIPSKVKTGDILNCPYSGSKKQITLPPGTYKLEVWGAEGGYRSSQSYSGKGGYSVGTITLTDKTVVYLYAGGAGGNSSTNTSAVVTGGFNGGGYRYGYKGGGGGSDVRIRQDSLYARVIVAGGGGSDGAASKNGMYGGGTAGGAASQNYGSHGYGGAQNGNTTSSSTYVATAQGTTNTGDSWYNGFGFGGFGCYANSGYAGAGGGGWYGGCGSYPDSSGDDDRGGGGGSGYIYTSSTAPSYPAGCLLNSSYYLTDASMIAGNASMTSPTGTTETGHYGNGYVRITVIEAQSSDEKYAKIDPNLPSGYTAVPYLKGTGTQYIDTGFKPTGYARYVIKMKMNAASNLIGIMGAETGWGSLSFAMWAKHLSYYNSTATNQTWDVSNTTDPVTLDFDKGVLKKNGTTVYSFTTSSFSCAFSAYLFGINRNGTLTEACNGLSIYECEIYNNDVLQRKFIPAKRTSDNVLGMYDTVNSKFYTNAGTGTFETSTETRDNWKKISTAYIKMPYQVPSTYTQLKYIYSFGSQYINTNFKPTYNTRVLMDFEPIAAYSSIVGYYGTRDVTSSTASNQFILWNSGSVALRTDYFGTNQSVSIPTLLTRQTVDKNKNVTTVGNTKVTNTAVTSGTCTNALYLFAVNNAGSVGFQSQMRLYSCKIYDNGTLVRNFVPAKRNSDSVAGLYDTVNSVFYTSASSTAFSAGSIASPWIEMKSMYVKMNGSWVEV